MLRTEKRNGVLFYLAVTNRKFAVIGNSGINSKVPENFREEQFTIGLTKGILKDNEIDALERNLVVSGGECASGSW